MKTIKIFSTTVCPKCARLKKYLSGKGVEFETVDMQSVEGLSELYFNGYFGVNAPVLQVGYEFFGPEKFFVGNEVNEEVINSLV